MIQEPFLTRRTLLAAALGGTAALLAGCSTGGIEPGEEDVPLDLNRAPAPTGLPDGMGSSEGDGVFPRTVRHFMGESVVEADPQRIVVLGTGQLDSLLTLGLVPVGAVARAGDVVIQPYLERAFPALADRIGAITATGTTAGINFERIAVLRPDLILDGGGREAEGYGILAQIAPTVITEGSGLNWKQDFAMVAAAVGRAGAAQAWMQDYDASAARLERTFGGSPPEVTFLRFHADRTRIYGVGSFVGSIAWDAGIARPESQRIGDTSLDISEEQIELIEADYLFYGVQGATDETPAEQFIANPLWDNLRVVREGRLLEVDHDPFFNSAGPAAARIVLDTVSAQLD